MCFDLYRLHQEKLDLVVKFLEVNIKNRLILSTGLIIIVIIIVNIIDITQITIYNSYQE